ncbi:PREDICTED: uncharacterized protein LOC101300961 [Fragaria vesca subsp. vesca]
MEEQYYDDHSSSNFKDIIPTAMSSFFSAYAPFAGYMFMLQSMNTNFIPYEFKSYVYSYLKSSLSYLLDPQANHITLYVQQYEADSWSEISQCNLVYDAAEVYLATKINPKTKYFRISQAPKQKVPMVAVTTNQEITDTFEDIKVQWRMIFPERYSSGNKCRIELTLHRKYKDKVINSYIPYVLARAEAIKDAEKTPKLYSYNSKHSNSSRTSYGMDDDYDYIPSSDKWSCVDLEHPATFETIAMEPELKKEIIEDLDKFMKRREFYKRVGKAWKRGYLLYGPPGTGKSSLVAAMANHLHFNIYDLELTSISSNEELRKALMTTTNQSIVVFEDIDCSKASVNRESTENKNSMVSQAKSKFTLSGLLNVIDGLWSSCGDERIIVFTTNHKERLDPALLRPGRMDMHIHMSYCTPKGFKTLASNYLGIQDTSKHQLCQEIEGLMESTNITPAEVCEELMRGGGGDDDDADIALEGLVNCLKRKRLETNKEEETGIAKRQKTENSLIIKHPIICFNSQLNIFPNPQVSNTMFTLNPKDMSTTASTLFSAYASFAASMMLIRSITDQLFPCQFRSYIYSFFGHFFTTPSSNLTLIVEECCGMTRNQVYDAAEVYLQTKISPLTERLKISKTPRKKSISIAMEKGEEITDTYNNDIELKWRFTEPEKKQDEYHPANDNKRRFELVFDKKHRDIVMDSYLPYVFARAKAIQEEEKVVRLYTRDSSLGDDDDNNRNSSGWGSIRMEHPSNFGTMAMDPELKRMVIDDLDRFVRRREFYKRVGKAWKRGYLLYGPPGTGKSSLIAAMANYLKFDVYDLELSSIHSNCELRRVLLSTSNRSILVIEDIDCCAKVQTRGSEPDPRMYQAHNNRLTLSGLLNFIDGLWSSCGDERIIVFTTNHKDRLDPALLRPGRMDMHIHMSYCTPSGFRVLASNYLGIHESNPHLLCREIEGLIESTEVTPADVAEELMKSDDADVTLKGLVNFLKKKKVENDKMKEQGAEKTEDQEPENEPFPDDNLPDVYGYGFGLFD